MNGTEFKNLRIEKNYERREIGQILDRDKDTVRAWETGRSPVPKFAADWISSASAKPEPAEQPKAQAK